MKSGDTLSEIGARFGVDWREIARVNNIENPDLIHPGQKFTIPKR
nr:LysM domain-containing protein [Nocardioides seonyuensis]